MLFNKTFFLSRTFIGQGYLDQPKMSQVALSSFLSPATFVSDEDTYGEKEAGRKGARPVLTRLITCVPSNSKLE